MESQVRTCCRIKVHFKRDLNKQVSLSSCVTTTRTWKQTQGKGIQLSTFPMGKSCGLSLSKPESKSANPPPLLAGRCLVVCQRTSLSRVMCLVASSFEDIFLSTKQGVRCEPAFVLTVCRPTLLPSSHNQLMSQGWIMFASPRDLLQFFPLYHPKTKSRLNRALKGTPKMVVLLSRKKQGRQLQKLTPWPGFTP